MVIIQFRQNLLHYGFPVQHSLCTYPELLTIKIYCSQLTVIQIDDLPMLSHKRLLLLLKIFRIHSRRCLFLLLCHVYRLYSGYFKAKISGKVSIFVEYIGYICAQYEFSETHIRTSPNLGGALEAIPSQLQLTISVCLAVRTSIDFPE